MLYDDDWVSIHSQCADGMAWGLDYVKNGAKDLASSIAGFDRADFLIWFLVKAGVLSIEMAFDLIAQVIRPMIHDRDGKHGYAEIVYHPSAPEIQTRERVERARQTAAEEANIRLQISSPQASHELMAICFLARMKLRMLDGEPDEALKDAQCVLNNLAAAVTGSLAPSRLTRQAHRALCDEIRGAVHVQAGS